MAEVRLHELPYILKDENFGAESINVQFIGACLMHQGLTHSQCFQDVFAWFNNRENGFFVEFGAADGVAGSNTLLLEKKYGWAGILAEPNRYMIPKIAANRTCVIDNRCVYINTGEFVDFNITEESDLSTIAGYGTRDEHANKRINVAQFKVETITLFDLLNQYSAPTLIDYVSVDTEGSELDILTAYFNNPLHTKYNINKISVEHNYDEQKRNALNELLTRNGYKRIYEFISRWDDFYIKA